MMVDAAHRFAARRAAYIRSLFTQRYLYRAQIATLRSCDAYLSETVDISYFLYLRTLCTLKTYFALCTIFQGISL